MTHYDYGARVYNPSIGRWLSVDPLKDDYASFSPYMFARNNPLLYIDPFGKSDILVHLKRVYIDNKVAISIMTVSVDGEEKGSFISISSGYDVGNVVRDGIYRAFLKSKKSDPELFMHGYKTEKLNQRADKIAKYESSRKSYPTIGIDLDYVEGGGFITIHQGNEPIQSQGCELPGLRVNYIPEENFYLVEDDEGNQMRVPIPEFGEFDKGQNVRISNSADAMFEILNIVISTFENDIKKKEETNFKVKYSTEQRITGEELEDSLNGNDGVGVEGLEYNTTDTNGH